LTMRFLILFALFGFSLAGQTSPYYEFTKKFTKSYRSIDEYEMRREVFMNNYQKMLDHNKKYDAGEVSWWMKVHEDMDLTSEEWRAKRTGGLPIVTNATQFTDTLDERIIAKMKEMGHAPRDFNWVDRGAVSSVKNQGQCGSCAAFAAMGAIESCYFIQSGTMDDDLSEQHILDCAYNHVVNDDFGSWGAYGCNGAFPNVYIDWLMNKEYNQEEQYYPYVSGNTGSVYQCNPNQNGYHKGSRVTGMYNVWLPTEISMENLVQMNPVTTAVSATDNWGSYGGGVMDDYLCCDAAYDSNCVYQLNHAVLVVGYGHDSHSGMDYWLIKNSWSTRWGEGGYFKLKKGTGHCGVGSLQQAIPYCG